jgi:hypothetical protein
MAQLHVKEDSGMASRFDEEGSVAHRLPHPFGLTNWTRNLRVGSRVSFGRASRIWSRW